jgi:CBS domain-containing protein
VLLKDICNCDVVCCEPQTLVRDAARLMRTRHVGDLVVVNDLDGERIPIAVVTDRDLTVEVLGDGRDASSTVVADVVRQPVVIAGEEEDSSNVLERMRINGVRRIPVVDRKGATIGIVTLDDLLCLFVDEAKALLEVISIGQKRERHARR